MTRIPHAVRVIGVFALLFVVVTIGAFVWGLITGSTTVLIVVE